MTARRNARREQLGRGRRGEDLRKRRLREVDTTKQKLLKLLKQYKIARRRAEAEGIIVDDGVYASVAAKLIDQDFHLRSGDLRGLHGHFVVRLPRGLSPEFLVELVRAFNNGTITYNRELGEELGWWNHQKAKNLSIGGD